MLSGCLQTAWHLLPQGDWDGERSEKGREVPARERKSVLARLNDKKEELKAQTEKDLKKAESFLAEARRLFQKRVNEGDRFTDNVLKQATDEWLEVTRELEM